ncbi:hypothetical protein [Sporosarcina sp.]|uniref:hypothetical protein n=1 Tax=Sporosarcina sp. TaxID=49982 RepID=UPI0026129607|nr:hypothetical protein [Sporosarcina sp.]
MDILNKERGFALVIVLFAIVFITIITAVFMRGAISNTVQEKTVDENNLVVVSAEAGLDYYKFELEKIYNTKDLEESFDEKVGEIDFKKATPEIYNKVRIEIARNFKENILDSRINSLKNEGSKTLVKPFFHKLTAAEVIDIPWTNIKPEDPIVLLLDGDVIGEMGNNGKHKALNFKLIYEFPPVKITGIDSPDDSGDGATPPEIGGGGMPNLKEPNSPRNPEEVVGIGKMKACSKIIGNIENKECTLSSKNEENYNINKSKLYITNSLDSWGKVNVENSYFNILENFKSKDLKVGDTDLVIKGILSAWNSIDISGSKLVVGNLNGGTTKMNKVHLTVKQKLEMQTADIENSFIVANDYQVNSVTNKFNKTDMKVIKDYRSSGSDIENSNIEVGGIMNTGGGILNLGDSSLSVGGNTIAGNGFDIENSIVKIGGNFETPVKFKGDDSDIFVGGNISAGNGSDLEDVNLVVIGSFTSDTHFKLEDSKISIGGTLKLGNGGKTEDSIIWADRIISSTTLDLDDTKIYGNYLKSDILILEDSRVCVKDLEVRKLSTDDSKVYYLNSSKPEHSNATQLTVDEYEKKCGSVNDEDSDEPVSSKGHVHINLQPPVLDKVTY